MTPNKDLDELDSNWGDEPEEDEADEDVDAGWGDVGSKHRTAAERAVARKVKAQQREGKRKSRDALIAQKQKKKQPKARPSELPPEPKKAKRDKARESAVEPRREPRVEREKRSRTTLIVIVAVVVIAAALAFFLSKR